MADLIVIYDPVKEVAAIVDTDNRIGFGPAMIGEDAELILTAWLESLPYDISEVNSVTLRDWFEQFAGRFLHDRETKAAEADKSTLEPSSGAGMVDAARAEREAVAAGGEPPAPAPADADMEAGSSTADQVSGDGAGALPAEQPGEAAQQEYHGKCLACDGTGQVPGSEEGVKVTCNLCRGTGQLPAPTPA